jgi:ribonuclease HI
MTTTNRNKNKNKTGGGVRPTNIDASVLAAQYTDSNVKEYVCYVDGGCFNNAAHNAKAYGSYKIFDPEDNIIAEEEKFRLVWPSSTGVPGRSTNNMAEAMSINRALIAIEQSKVLEDKDSVVLIKSDSELIIRQIKGIYKIKCKQLLHISKERGHILNRIRRNTGRDPWYCIKFSKVARKRIVDVLGH